MGARAWLRLGLWLALGASVLGLSCWRCGQYTDGVGSITPCANKSAVVLAVCPINARHCIKYVSELTVVRDCVPTCTEKEWWGARTFCCDIDGCNSALATNPTALSAILFTAVIAILFSR